MMYYGIEKISQENRKLLGFLQREKHVAEKRHEAYRAKLLKTLIKGLREYGQYDDGELLRARLDCRNKGWHDGLRILTDLECDIKKFREGAA